MRIIGGKDYYDNALMFGRDESICFVRSRHIIPVDSFREPEDFNQTLYSYLRVKCSFDRPSYYSRNTLQMTDGRYSVDTQSIVVILGDKLFKGCLVHIYDKRSLSPSDSVSQIFYTSKGIQKFLEKNNVDIVKIVDNVENKMSYDEKIEYFMKSFVNGFNKDNEETVPKNIRDILIEEQITVLTYAPSMDKYYHGKEICINSDNLHSLDFGKIMDPYQVFQEISMWIGGVLPKTEQPMYQLSDKEKIDKHGFDKWSFRKMPQKANG